MKIQGSEKLDYCKSFPWFHFIANKKEMFLNRIFLIAKLSCIIIYWQSKEAQK